MGANIVAGKRKGDCIYGPELREHKATLGIPLQLKSLYVATLTPFSSFFLRD